MAKGHRSQVKREKNAQKDTRPGTTLPHARVSVQKVCLVLDIIRGEDLQVALGIVTYDPRYASSLIKKLLESTAANTENNNGIDPTKLYVEECYANQGPAMKRVGPRAQGCAYRIEKRMSHITVVPNKRWEVNMGQRVNPHDLRVGVIKDWDSKWYAEADFTSYLVEDYNMRKFPKEKLFSASISKIEIERVPDRVKIIIYTAKPGVVIGRGDSEIEKLEKEIQRLTDKKLLIDIKEIKRPDRNAQLVAESITGQLESHVSFCRAIKSTIGRTMEVGVKGTKTAAAGRLSGADMARIEFYSEGTAPLQTLRADIDYGFAEVDITYGKIGAKIWIYEGEALPTKGSKEGNDK